MRLWAVLALCSCYEAPAADYCATKCSDSCPDGYACMSGTCVATDGHCAAQLTNAIAIGVGSRHACALGADNTISCWGDNGLGQVGTGSALVPAPAKVTGTYQALAVGAEHTCALTLDGVPTCWGRNADGETLGATSGPVLSPMPVEFAGTAPTFGAIAAGTGASCAIDATDQSLWCWGDAATLGDASQSAPAQVAGGLHWESVSVGFNHVCGLTDQGVACFGSNNSAQVDQNQPNPVPAPVVLSSLPGTAFFVSAGDEATCALVDGTLDAGGSLYCWGADNNRFGTNANFPPMQLGALTTWTAVRAGGQQVCAVRGGQTYCFGFENEGTLGDGLWFHSRLYDDAQPAIGAATAVDVAIGAKTINGFEEHACSLQDGKVSCWGINAHGELGSGPARTTDTPVEVPRPSGGGWTKLVAGESHLCAQTNDGMTWCWGDDERAEVSGQVGRGDLQPCIQGQRCDAPLPVQAPATAAVDDLVAGDRYTCARAGTTVQCWGRNERGLLGANVQGATGLANVIAPTGAWAHLIGGTEATCGLTTTDGTPYCWGHLPGDGGGDVGMPFGETAPDAANLDDIAFADDFACGVRLSDQHRVCWRNGTDDDGALGAGSNIMQSTPLAFPNATVTVPLTTAIAAHSSHTCSIDDGGKVWCWGHANTSETIGNTMGQIELSPTPIDDASGQQLTGCTRIATVDDHSCAICSQQLLCWGDDGSANAKLGRPSTGRDATARPVAGGLTYGEVGLFGGGGCAITADQAHMMCWGEGNHGQLGNGSHDRNLPTPVGAMP